MAYPWMGMRTTFKVNFGMGLFNLVLESVFLWYNTSTTVDKMWMANLAFMASILYLVFTAAKVLYKGQIAGKNWWPLLEEVVDLILSVNSVLITGSQVFPRKKVAAIKAICTDLVVLLIQGCEVLRRKFLKLDNGYKLELFVASRNWIGNGVINVSLRVMPEEREELFYERNAVDAGQEKKKAAGQEEENKASGQEEEEKEI